MVQTLLSNFPRVATTLIPPSTATSISTSLKNIFTGSGSGVLKTGLKVGGGATAVGAGGIALNESLKSIFSPLEDITGANSGSISAIIIIAIIVLVFILVVKR